MVDAVAPQPQLDYHLILSPATGAPSTADVEGIVVEEFVRGDDWATVGLSSAGWTAGEGGWWSSASFSRRMRVEPELAGRVTPTSRYVAETVYRQRGAGQLPAEAVLRTYFRDHQPFATAPPLRLGPTDPPDGSTRSGSTGSCSPRTFARTNWRPSLGVSLFRRTRTHLPRTVRSKSSPVLERECRRSLLAGAIPFARLWGLP